MKPHWIDVAWSPADVCVPEIDAIEEDPITGGWESSEFEEDSHDLRFKVDDGEVVRHMALSGQQEVTVQVLRP